MCQKIQYDDYCSKFFANRTGPESDPHHIRQKNPAQVEVGEAWATSEPFPQDPTPKKITFIYLY